MLARDRLGTRPLYVGELAGGGAVFATSMKALLAAGIDAAVDRDAVVRSLVLGYVPAPRTMLAGVRQLGPGEAWWLGPWPKTWCYYRPREQLDRRRSLAVAARQLDRTVSGAVANALPARGRVGAFLSGGLDSSLVLARLAERGVPVRAFTLHFGDHLAGELRYARAVAGHLGVPHQVFELDDRKFCDGITPALDELEDLLGKPRAVAGREVLGHPDVVAARAHRQPGTRNQLALDLCQAAYQRWRRFPLLHEAVQPYAQQLADRIDHGKTISSGPFPT